MKEPPHLEYEEARQSALDELGILDTASDPALDAIARLATAALDVPIALVSLVDRERQWFKARCGLDVRQTPRGISFCGHAIAEDAPFIVADTLKDERFFDNPLVVDTPRIRFYAGFPLKTQGQLIGTLCVIDRVPRTLSDRHRRILSALASQVVMQLEWRRRVLSSTEPPSPSIDLTLPKSKDDPISFRVQLVPRVAVTHLGPEVEMLTGWAPDDFYQDPGLGWRLVHPEDRPMLELIKTNPRLFQDRMVSRWRGQEGWVWLEHHCHSVMQDGQRAALEGHAWLIPRESEALPEKTLDLMAHDVAQLEVSRHQLMQGLLHLKDSSHQLASRIMHDAKNHLSAIVGNAHFMLEDARVQGQDETPAQDIILAAHALQRMIMNLLDVDRSERGQLQAVLAEVEIAKVVERACDKMKMVCVQYDQSLILDIDATIREVVLPVDTDLIERAVCNVIDNSTKYAPVGSVIRVRVFEAKTHEIQVEILDEGAGIPEAYKAQIFELHSEDEPNVDQPERLPRGLGLTFCKRAMEAHGGRIWVDDRPEGGSRFCLALPR